MTRLTALSALLVASFVGTAHATQYPGWGDTGWIYASKYECCNQAIAIASQYSAQACYTAGGSPQSFAGGGQRGSCRADFQQDDEGNMMYRCYGEAAIWCR
jgi:hypothetical protein